MTIRTLLHVLALAFFTLTCAHASAAEPQVKVKIIDFEEDYLQGEIAMPDGAMTEAFEARDLSNLVRARESFVKELLKAVEDL